MTKSPTKIDDHRPVLGDLIQRIQQELTESEASRLRGGAPALFQVDTLTIEAQFIVSESTTGKGGFDLKIVTAGSDFSYKSDQIQKITLALKAVPEVTASPDHPLSELIDSSLSGRYPRPRED